jgi:hypothetical protein
MYFLGGALAELQPDQAVAARKAIEKCDSEALAAAACV